MQLSAMPPSFMRHVTDCIQSRAKGFPFETQPGILRMRKTGRKCPWSGLAAPTPGQRLAATQ